MNLYAIRFGYDGNNYSGWQRQKDRVTVQQTLEDCLFEILNKETSLTASGRTDAGVSALSQVATFYTDKEIDEKSFIGRLNFLLPNSIKVYKVKKMEQDFHAIKSATSKTYLYNFYISNVAIPYLDRFATRFSEKADVNIIENNLKHFIGEHDFSSFCNTESTVKSKVREVYDFTLSKNIGYYTLSITGNGFLYNMIRIIIGTLVDLSSNKISLTIPQILSGKDRTLAGLTAPAKGLVLLKVNYNENI